MLLITAELYTTLKHQALDSMSRACFAELKGVSPSADITSSLSAGREAFAKLLQVIEREGERERETVAIYVCMYVCMYVYI